MKDNITISIIVPIYNVEKYLIDCLESIINQTYRNLQIILIDDGSTDNSGKICDEYAKKDNRITVIHQENLGVSKARNEGLKIAKGDYIGFVDPDDFIESTMYENLISDALNNECEIAVCGVRNIEYSTKQILNETKLKENKKIDKENFLERILDGKETSAIWNKIFSKEIVKANYFDENFKIGEDFKWLFTLIKNTPEMKIFLDHKILYNWNKRNDSAVNNKNNYNKNIEKSIMLTYEIKEYVKENISNLYSLALKKYLIMNIMAYERMENKERKKKLKIDIENARKEYLKFKDIDLKEKLKVTVQCKVPKFYSKLRRLKEKNSITTTNNKIAKTNIYNVMKIICVLLVVIGHITRMYTSSSVFLMRNSSRILEYVTKVIYTFQMPCFMLISGLVFGWCIEKGKYKENCRFIKNKIKRLLIPYFTFGFLYVAPVMVMLKITDLNYFDFCYEGIVKALDCRHLWYLVSLFIIFITTIFVKNYYIKKRGYLLLIINFALFFMSDFVTPMFQLQNTLAYQLYFYIGLVLNKYFDKIINKISKNNVVFIIIFGFLLLTKVFVPENKIYTFIYAILGVLEIISIAIYLMNFDIEKYGLYKTLSKTSFGIYLLHPMIIYIIFNWAKMYTINPYIISFISFIITMSISIVLTKLIQKTKLRIIVGEK